jgi:hypothetical protein
MQQSVQMSMSIFKKPLIKLNPLIREILKNLPKIKMFKKWLRITLTQGTSRETITIVKIIWSSFRDLRKCDLFSTTRMTNTTQMHSGLMSMCLQKKMMVRNLSAKN